MHKAKREGLFWTKFFWSVAIVLFSSVLAIWITGYTYIYKTLIYTYPDIDDLSIFQTRMVNEKLPQPWPLASEYNKKEIPAETKAALKEFETVAYVIVRDDSLVHEEYHDNYSAVSLSNSFSVAKSIVSILIGIAVEEGKFSLDDKVGTFIPSYSSTPNDQLTIRDLLLMSSGLDWDEKYASLFSKTTEAYYGSDLTEQVSRLKVIQTPGKKFQYMSCNTVLLSLILSKTTGKTLSEYASEKLWIPLHAEQPAYWSLDHSNGEEKAYCCFYSSARDFARIGKLYLDSGKADGRQIVPLDYVRQSLTPNELLDETGKKVDYYGYHWWLAKRNGHPMFYARGILGQYIVVIPDERMIIVRLGIKRGTKLGKHYKDMMNYVDGALNAYGRNKHN